MQVALPFTGQFTNKSDLKLARLSIQQTEACQQLALGAFSYDMQLNTEALLLTAERNYVAAA